MKPLRIGLIGYGFMGRTHSNAFTQVNNFFDLEYRPVLKAICARDAGNAKAFASKWRYESIETDWRKLIARDDIDLIDIAAPNNVHAEIAIAAAQAGKMILCEKPLALNGPEAEKMVAVVTKAKVPNMVWYNYRRVPAVTLAKQLIDEGKLGRIFHYRAKFLQDWTISKDLPQGGAGLWRLDVKVAGSGATGDLLAHCIDTAMWLNGAIDSVTATTETFIKERKHTLTGKVEKVGIDDASMFLARFSNGSLATFESTRYALGHKGLYTFEINGEHASIFWDLHDPHRLQYFDHRDQGTVRGWRSLHITDGDHLYMKNWWVPGLEIGYAKTFVRQVADFIQGLQNGKMPGPTFKDGLATDYKTDAVLQFVHSFWAGVQYPGSSPSHSKLDTSIRIERQTAFAKRHFSSIRIVGRKQLEAERIRLKQLPAPTTRLSEIRRELSGRHARSSALEHPQHLGSRGGATFASKLECRSREFSTRDFVFFSLSSHSARLAAAVRKLRSLSNRDLAISAIEDALDNL